MKKIFCLTAIFLAALSVEAQVARLQIIHNSADTALRFVDIYFDGVLTFDSLQFRYSTAFFNFTANTDIEIKVAEAQTEDVTFAFYTDTLNLASGNSYIAVANGEINQNVHSPFEPFGLDIKSGALEIGSNASGTDFMVCQGSSDVGDVDILETDLIQLTAFEDLSYGGFSEYLGLFTANYVLSVTSSDGATTIGSFSAPFSTYGWGGEAVAIVCSGFVNQSANSNGSPFGLWASLPAGGALIELPVLSLNLTSRMQFIHNSADAFLEAVDVYIDELLIADDLSFRYATPFVDVQAGGESVISVAPSNSTSPSDAFFAMPFDVYSGQTYVVTLGGILSETGYDPAIPISLEVLEGAREVASIPEDTQVLFFNGITDMPVIDVNETEVLGMNIEDNLEYGEYSSYLSGTTDDYVYEVTNGISGEVINTYLASFETNGWLGLAITVLSSGFVNVESNSFGPEFGLWVALPSGGSLLPLALVPDEPVFCSVQLVHNSADAALEVVDVYANGSLVADDLMFRSATGFFELQCNEPVTIAVAASTSTSALDALFSQDVFFSPNESHIMMLSGIFSTSGYNPSPVIGLQQIDSARETSVNPDETDFVVHHGSTDAPDIDINELTLPLDGIAENLPYGFFTNYQSLGADANYGFSVTDASGSVFLGQYELPLNTLELSGESGVIFSSGFLTPANNSNGPEFGIWVAMADGYVFELPVYVGLRERSLLAELKAYPSPAKDYVRISGQLPKPSSCSIFIRDILGRTVYTTGVKEYGTMVNDELNISGLNNGLYSIEFTDGESRTCKKIEVSK